MQWWLIVLLLVAGCAQREPRRESGGSEGAPGAPIVVMGPDVPMARLGGGAPRGGSIVFSHWGPREVLLVADHEQHALRVLDASTLETVVDTPLGAEPSQVAVVGGRVVVALRDRNEVVAFDASVGGELREANRTATAVEPVAVAPSADREGVLVSSAWGRQLARYDRDLEREWAVSLPLEPRGVAVAPSGRIYVSHLVGSLITEVSEDATAQGYRPTTKPRTLAGTDTVMLATLDQEPPPDASSPDDPRWQSAASPGPTRWAQYRGSGIDFIDEERPGASPRLPPRQLQGCYRGPIFSHEERHLGQAYTVVPVGDEVFSFGVLVQPATQLGGRSYGGGRIFPAQEPVVAVVPGDGEEAWFRTGRGAFARSKKRTAGTRSREERDCLLPRDAAHHVGTNALLVACVGSDQVLAYRPSRHPLGESSRGRWNVPAGPSGIAVHPKSPVAYVWSPHARTVSSLDLTVAAGSEASSTAHGVAAQRTLPRIDGAPELREAQRRGRRLFYRSNDDRISRDGRACASCHPDGRADGLSWPTPQANQSHQPLRQTPMLSGRLDISTAPFGWSGSAATVPAHIEKSLERLGGKGLGERDLADLVTFCESMTGPSARAAHDALAERGRQLFFDEAVGCATCHLHGGGSDGFLHSLVGTAVVTPSLRYVGGTAPYFHDGRYETLDEVLAKTATTMGFAPDLGEADRRALVAFMKTL